MEEALTVTTSVRRETSGREYFPFFINYLYSEAGGFWGGPCALDERSGLRRVFFVTKWVPHILIELLHCILFGINFELLDCILFGWRKYVTCVVRKHGFLMGAKESDAD